MASATGLKLKRLGGGGYETQCAKIRIFNNGQEWVAIEKATGNRVCYATSFKTLKRELGKKPSHSGDTETTKLAEAVLKLSRYISQYTTREMTVSNALGARGTSLLNDAISIAIGFSEQNEV